MRIARVLYLVAGLLALVGLYALGANASAEDAHFFITMAGIMLILGILYEPKA